MAKLIVRPEAVRNNLCVLQSACFDVGTDFMFVFKEAPLHPYLAELFLRGTAVSRLGIVSWTGTDSLRIPGGSFSQVCAVSDGWSSGLMNCETFFCSSLKHLETVRDALGGRLPALRIPLEAGDLRDGMMPEEIPSFTRKAAELGFDIAGLSVNFACIVPEPPAIEKLALADACCASLRGEFPRADISVGGTDILEYAADHALPSSVNEIRCGTGAMLGVYPLSGRPVPGCRQDAFRFEAQVLESRNKFGRRYVLLDAGSFHTAMGAVTVVCPGMRYVGASSVFSVFDVTDCPECFCEGASVRFGLDYRTLARCFVSRLLAMEIV